MSDSNWCESADPEGLYISGEEPPYQCIKCGEVMDVAHIDPLPADAPIPETMGDPVGLCACGGEVYVMFVDDGEHMPVKQDISEETK